MNFFQHQESAHKRTYLLIFLFALAVLSLIMLTNLLLVAVFLNSADAANMSWNMIALSLSSSYGLMVSAFVMLGIGGASFYRWRQLRGGGKVIATSLGGRLVSTETPDHLEKRLLNVVEEIALAAGVPVPPAYILPETSINAFAAGYNLSDAVVAVTEGALMKLNRQQLQGVIAHEFSHIFNGDMRLNSRIMALLFGITCISWVGRFLLEFGRGTSSLRSSSKSTDKNAAGGIFLLGLGLFIVGSLGTFFGILIQAAVSRQREFLADASAVQYTRNPDSISEVLKIIGHEGSRINSPYRTEAAHLFFAQALNVERMPLIGLFSSHPPLAVRIRRIEPRWDGYYLSPSSTFQKNQTLRQQQQQASVRQQERVHQLQEQIAHPLGAAGMVVAMLNHYEHTIVEPPLSIHAPDLKMLVEHDYFTWIARSLPALKELSIDEYQAFRSYLQASINRAQEPLMVWCLLTVITHYLDAHFFPIHDQGYKVLGAKTVEPAIAVLMSVLAHAGHSSHEERQLAFTAGCDAGGFFSVRYLDNADFKLLERAIKVLRRAHPPLLKRLQTAILECVRYDAHITATEINLVHAISTILEQPMDLQNAQKRSPKLRSRASSA